MALEPPDQNEELENAVGSEVPRDIDGVPTPTEVESAPDQITYRGDQPDQQLDLQQMATAVTQALGQQQQQLPTQPEPEAEQDPTFLSEVGGALGGGAIDAVESIGGFAELTGDTLKTGLNSLFGQPVDASQNPFDKDYKHGDAGWLDIPDEIRDDKGNLLWEQPEAKTAIGKFGQGLVEFGLLSWGTAGIGGAAFGGLKLGVRGIGAAKAAGASAQTIQFIKIGGKAVKIGSEGAIADLISNRSEHANIMNLANEHVPFLVPVIGDMIAVDPEDNPWTARFKTIVAGAGLNYVGHGIGAIYKGFWTAGKAKIAGATDEAANAAGHKAMVEDFNSNMDLDEEAFTQKAIDQYQQGNGLSRSDPQDEYMRQYNPEGYDEWVAKNASDIDEDAVRASELRAEADTKAAEFDDVFDDTLDINPRRFEEDQARQLDPFVNNTKFEDSEHALIRAKPPKEAVRGNIREGLVDLKSGGEGRGVSPVLSDTYLNAMSRGDANLRQYINEVADELAEKSFKGTDNRYPYSKVKEMILRQANDILNVVEGGGDIANNLKKALDDPDNYRLYADDGTVVTTISPTQKAANVLVMNALAKQVQGIATGALSIADDIPIGRQADMIFDSMRVILTENKKMGLMWGLDGKAQQEFALSPQLKDLKNRNIAEINQQVDEYITSLRSLIDKERWDDLDALIELHALSGGKVRTLAHINEYLSAQIGGGRMDDVHIKGRVRKELQGTFFNSVLSSFSTPIKAIGGTNMLALLRPMQAWMGAALRGNDKEMFIAAAQIDGMGRAFSESFEVAKRNWDLGVKRKAQQYQGKFDLEADFQDWKRLKRHYERYAPGHEQAAYGFLDKVVDFNTSPFVKYSINAMGAGDAAARTIIGRQYMRQRAALDAWEKSAANSTLDDSWAMQVVRDTEESFRDEIFSKDKYGMYKVSQKGASMAGDEAAMTRGLQENFKGFELISNIPGMKAFFPFVRTGFNYLDVTFQHTPLTAFRDKYRDLTGFLSSHNGGRNLDKYGIRPEDLAYEVALMEGRMAMGTSIVGMASIAAMMGNITGNVPVNKEDRDLWKANGIQPKSFKVGDTYISYEKLEIFNTIFSTTADVVGNANLLGEKDTDEWLKKLTYMTAAVVVDQSMLSGVEDLARLMNPETAEDLLLRTGSRFVRSHLPYAGLMGQIGDVVDANRKEANTFNELLVQRDAFFKSTVPPKYDVLSEDRSGKELTYGPEQPLMRLFNSLSPIGITYAGDDPVKKGLKAIRYNLPETLGTYRGEALNSYEQSELERELSMGGLRKELEYIFKNKRFQRSLEQYKKLGLKESDGYKLKDQLFTMFVRKAFKKHKDIAMQKLLAKNTELNARITLLAQKKAFGKSLGSGNPRIDNSEKEAMEYLMTLFPK